MERKVLGRGLGALIPERISAAEKGEIHFLETTRIKSNPFQPRENFKEEELRELVNSIKEKGILQPILVRKTGDSFELIAGERRLRAARMLQLTEVPVIIKDIQDQESLELSLIENIQREELNPIEEARAFQQLIEKFDFTQEQVSQVVGKARASVTNSLRLLKLPKIVQEEIKQGRISFGHGKVLLEIESPDLIVKFAQEIISNSLSVRELERLINSAKFIRSTRKSNKAPANPLIQQLEELLQQALGTKVRIARDSRKRGRIIIEFYSDQDLERILGVMKK